MSARSDSQIDANPLFSAAGLAPALPPCTFCTSGRPAERVCDYPAEDTRKCKRAMCVECAKRVLADDWEVCPTHAPFVFEAANHRIIIADSWRLTGGERIDRPTPLGNPYRLQSEAERPQCLEQYRKWLWIAIRTKQSAQRQELHRLAAILEQRDLVLLCHCVPRICHGQVIAKALIWLLSGASV